MGAGAGAPSRPLDGRPRGEGRRTGGDPPRGTGPSAPYATRTMPGDLVDRLIAASEIHGDFVLSSGQRSSVYFDKFRFLTDPVLLRELAVEVRRLVPDGVTHVGAPEGAATLLLAAVALEAALPMVVVRKEPKSYGTRAQVEGSLGDGARVAVLEDVSTTGHQVEAAAKAL